MNRKRNLEENPNLETNQNDGKDYALILHDDDVHDFLYVIESLMNVCKHDSIQAEQCTFLVHYHGKCEVKIGKYSRVKAMHDRLIEKGLRVSLN